MRVYVYDFLGLQVDGLFYLGIFGFS